MFLLLLSHIHTQLFPHTSTTFPHSQATGLHQLFNGGLSSCYNGFGRPHDKSCSSAGELARTADGILTFTPTSEDPKALVQELALLLTDGRLNDRSRTVIENAYVKVKEFLGKQHALRTALKLLVLTSEFHSTKCVSDAL